LHKRASRTVALRELSDRSLDPEQRARAEGTRGCRGAEAGRARGTARGVVPEQPLGESSAADAPHVQLEEIAVVRATCDREAAPAAPIEQHVEVLARME